MKNRIVLFVCVAATLASLMACMAVNLPQVTRVRGSGKVVTETRQVSGFSRLSVGAFGELTLVQGDQESLVIEAEENILPNITSQVRDDTLYIRIDSPGLNNIDPSKDIKYKLTMKDIHRLEASGAVEIIASQIKTDSLEIESSGAGSMKIAELYTDHLKVEVSGAGSVDIEKGKAPIQEIEISGAGSYNAENLECQRMKIDISGAGNAVIWVKDNLEIEMSGAGNLQYYGSPAVVQDTSGAGRIRSLGEK